MKQLIAFFGAAALVLVSGLSLLGPGMRAAPMDADCGHLSTTGRCSGGTLPGEELRSALLLLENELPLEYEVELDLSEMEDWGETDWDGEGFVMHIHPEAEAEVIAHEYAHAMTWDVPGDPHGPVWGVAYSQCYQLLVEE
jgi:hypothetical protein